VFFVYFCVFLCFVLYVLNLMSNVNKQHALKNLFSLISCSKAFSDFNFLVAILMVFL